MKYAQTKIIEQKLSEAGFHKGTDYRISTHPQAGSYYTDVNFTKEALMKAVQHRFAVIARGIAVTICYGKDDKITSVYATYYPGIEAKGKEIFPIA